MPGETLMGKESCGGELRSNFKFQI